MKDTIEYHLPVGLIGKIAHQLFVNDKLHENLNYQYKFLAKHFK